MYSISALQMDGENLFSNTECWKDHFLADKAEFSNDKLPPEVKTYCQVVDGISKDNGLNILVVPICASENDQYTQECGIKQSLGSGLNGGDGGERDNMIDRIEDRKKNDYYKLVNEKHKELCNQNKPFGMLYVYHNKYCIKHVQPLVYLNKDNAYQAVHEASIDLLFPIAGSDDGNDNKKYYRFNFEENHLHKDFFSCRIFAIQFLLSLYKHQNDILKLDKKFLYDGSWQFFCLPEDFIKYAQVNIDLLAGLLCIFDKIRLNKNYKKELLDGLYDASCYLEAHSGKAELQEWLSEQIKLFGVSKQEIDNKIKMLKDDVYRQNKDGKWCNVGLAKLGAEWYAKYAGKKFLEEHNNIIKNYNKEHNIEYYNDIKDSEAYFHENFDTHHYEDPNNQHKPDRHGALATIDETYNKIMEQKKNSKNQQSTQNNNANSKDSNDKINGNANNEDNNSRKISEEIDNNESSGKGNKEETKKLKTSSNEENNKNAKSDEENNKNTKLVDVDDKNISEKSHDITDKQQEATDTTGNRCWPFGWCSSCNGCAIFNQKIEQANEQTFTK